MVHSARPPASSRSSLASRGPSGACRTSAASGERKEDLLQSGLRHSGARAQLGKRAGAANVAVDEQHEAVADALGVEQLVNGQNQRASAARDVAQHGHDLARLAQIEAVERLVHEEEWLRGDERKRE